LEAANVEMAAFSLEIAAGVTPERLAEINTRKAWLNENIPSFKVSTVRIIFNIYYIILKGRGGFLFLPLGIL
jgi:hypothetical protein